MKVWMVYQDNGIDYYAYIALYTTKELAEQRRTYEVDKAFGSAQKNYLGGLSYDYYDKEYHISEEEVLNTPCD